MTRAPYVLPKSDRAFPNRHKPGRRHIAIGHPLRASGVRLAGSAAHQLEATGAGVGVATMCIGVGQDSTLVPER